MAICFFFAFVKAVKSGQYDDDYTPSVRMLFDDELIKAKVKKEEKTLETKKQSNTIYNPEIF